MRCSIAVCRSNLVKVGDQGIIYGGNGDDRIIAGSRNGHDIIIHTGASNTSARAAGYGIAKVK